MSTSRILQVRRSDNAQEVVVINVISDSAQALEVSLQATEGSAPYSCKVRDNQLRSLRSSGYHGDDREWAAILGWLLLRRKAEERYATATGSVELVATVSEETEIILTIRQNISGITHRLGTLALKHDENLEVELFDWAAFAARDRDDAEDEVLSLQRRFEEQQQMVTKLNNQLRDLIDAKKKHEDELLEKFRHLLNSKKAKIRDQMRLLSTAKIDGKTAEKVASARGSDRSSPRRREAPRPTRKRKTGATPELGDNDEEDEPKMANEDPDTDPDVANSLEQQTETEDESDNDFQAPPAVSQSQGTTSGVGSQTRASTQPRNTQSVQASGPSRGAPVNDYDDDSSDSGFEPAPPASQRTGRNGSTSQANSHSQTKLVASPNFDSPPPARKLPFGRAVFKKASEIAQGYSQNSLPASAAIETRNKGTIDEEETDDEL